MADGHKGVDKMYSTNQFLNKLYKEIQPKKDLINLNSEEFEKEKELRTDELKKLLKLEELGELFDKDIYIVQRYS